MAFPERFSNLPEYAFPRLRGLLDSHAPGGEAIAMTIGEPRHAMPDFVGPVLAQSLAEFGKYPANDGTPELLAAISAWLKMRYRADVAPERIMALNGTREGLFNAAIALCPEAKNGQKPVILIPNPFYQVYAVAAAAVGAEAVFVPATEETGFLPDYASLPPEVLDRTAIAYLCSPANPQGAVASRAYLSALLTLARPLGSAKVAPSGIERTPTPFVTIASNAQISPGFTQVVPVVVGLATPWMLILAALLTYSVP